MHCMSAATLPLSLERGFTQPVGCLEPLGVNSEEAANRKGPVKAASKTPRAPPAI